MTVTGPLVYRKKVIQIDLETDRGSAVTPNDVLMVNMMTPMRPTAEVIERPILGAWTGGASTAHLGPRIGTVSFTCEMRGSGASTTLDPGIAALLQCCGLKLATGVYAPCGPADGKTCTITCHEDGVLKSLYGAAGTFSLEGEAGKPLMAKFDMTGLWVAPTAVAVPAISHTAVVAPRLSSCTWTLAIRAVRIARFGFNFNGQVVPRGSLDAAQGIVHYMVVDRKPVFNLAPEAEAIADFDWHDMHTDYTEMALSLLVGSVTNNKFTIAAPKCQIREIDESDDNNVMRWPITLSANMNAGDDEFTITPG